MEKDKSNSASSIDQKKSVYEPTEGQIELENEENGFERVQRSTPPNQTTNAVECVLLKKNDIEKRKQNVSSYANLASIIGEYEDISQKGIIIEDEVMNYLEKDNQQQLSNNH